MSAPIISRVSRVVAVVCVMVGALCAPAVADTTGFPPILVGGGTTDPGGGGNTGGGTTGTPTPPPEGTRWVYGGLPLTPEQYSWNNGLDGGDGGARIAGTCQPAPLPYNDWQYATAVTWVYAVNSETGAFAGGYSWTCVTPPQPVDTAVQCVSRMTGRVTNEQGPSAFRELGDLTSWSAWAGDRKDAGKCSTSGLSVEVAAPMDDLGWYLVSVRGVVHDCLRRSYPGTSRSDRIVSCGNGHDRVETRKGGVWCDPPTGWDYSIGANAWSHGYSWVDCVKATDTLIACNTADDVVTYRGEDATREEPVEAFRDGVARDYVFEPFKPTGAVSISNRRTRLVVQKGSSPYRTNTAADAANQPFEVDGASDWRAGGKTRYPVAFYAPGVPGKPFRVTREVIFDAKIKVPVTVIRRINFLGDPLKVETTTEWRVITVRDVVCASPVASVDVFRARNSNR